jgi:hypothetical protein
MFRDIRSTTYGLMYFLVALSVMGIIVASQQYFILQSEEKMMLARRTLDESFIVGMKAMGSESNPEMAKELAHQKMILEGSYSSAAAIIRQLEIRALADTVAWCVVLVIAGLTLVLNARKNHKLGEPPAVSTPTSE